MFNLLATIVQVVCLPLNYAITSSMPDLSSKITQVTNSLANLFNSITWGLGLLPDLVVETLLFIVSVEIAKHTIYVSTHTLIKVWNLVQKIKFW